MCRSRRKRDQDSARAHAGPRFAQGRAHPFLSRSFVYCSFSASTASMIFSARLTLNLCQAGGSADQARRQCTSWGGDPFACCPSASAKSADQGAARRHHPRATFPSECAVVALRSRDFSRAQARMCQAHLPRRMRRTAPCRPAPAGTCSRISSPARPRAGPPSLRTQEQQQQRNVRPLLHPLGHPRKSASMRGCRFTLLVHVTARAVTRAA